MGSYLVQRLQTGIHTPHRGTTRSLQSTAKLGGDLGSIIALLHLSSTKKEISWIQPRDTVLHRYIRVRVARDRSMLES